MTERGLSRAVHLRTELDALRRVAAEEGSAGALRAIDAQARALAAGKAGGHGPHSDGAGPARRGCSGHALPGGQELGDGSSASSYVLECSCAYLGRLLSLAARKSNPCGLRAYLGEKSLRLRLQQPSRGKGKEPEMKAYRTESASRLGASAQVDAPFSFV